MEGFWVPRWGQVRSKSLQKSIFKSMIKKIAFQNALGADFGGFGTPFGSQDRPQNPHLGAKIGPRPPNLEPRWARDLQLAAKDRFS